MKTRHSLRWISCAITTLLAVSPASRAEVGGGAGVQIAPKGGSRFMGINGHDRGRCAGYLR